MSRLLACTLLLAGLLALLVAGATDRASGAAHFDAAFVEPQVRRALESQPAVSVLVGLREPPALAAAGLDIAALRSQVAARQSRVLDGLSQDEFTVTYRYQSIPALAGRVTKEGLADLAGRPDVAEISINGQGSAALAHSAPLIHAFDVHDEGIVGAGIVVAVLDSGMDVDHPDLTFDIAYERCFLEAGGCPAGAHPGDDDHGHGTNVAGIITGDGVVAPRGIAPGARIAVYKILNRSGTGFFSDWLAALDDIITNHPEVGAINMSLQSSASCASVSAMSTAISTLREQGRLTFVATGNHGRKDTFTVPACAPAAVTVGATYDRSLGRVNGWKSDCADLITDVDQVACWSDSAPELDLLAPGGAITSTGRGGGVSTFFGTSQAAPHAAAVAALLLEARPELTADEVEAWLKATGTLVTDDLDDEDPTTNRTTPRVDARVALLIDGQDFDGDGCLNEDELGSDPLLGGMRNPLNPWDFYDINGDRVINLFDDVLAVILAFGPATAGQYQAAFDRSPPPANAAPWHLGPPDGTIDIANDVLGIAAQFGHRCADAPSA